MLAFSALKGAAWLVMSRSIGRLIDFCTLLFLVRSLVPEDFGIAALAISFVAIVDMVLEIPVMQALVRLRSIERAHLDTAFTLGIIRSIGVAIILIAGAWPYAYFNGEHELFKIVCFLAIAPVVKGLSSPAIVQFARNINFRPSFLIDVTSRSCAFVVAVTIVTHGGGYWAIVSNYVTSSVISSAFSYVLARYRPRLSLAKLPDFYTFTGWFTLSQIVSALNWQYDRLMMGLFSTDKSLLGHYAVADNLAIVPSQSFIGPALQPVMSVFSKINHDPARIRSAFLKASRAAMLAAVPINLGIALTSDLVTTILLGPAWNDAGLYLAMLSIAMLSSPYFQTICAACIAIDQPKVIFKLSAIELVLRVITLTAAFLLYSVPGAAFGRIILAVMILIIYMIQVRQSLGIGLLVQIENLWKISLAGAIMSMAVIAARQLFPELAGPPVFQLVLIAAGGALVYFASLFGLGVRVNLRPGSLAIFDKWWKRADST